MSSNGSHLFSIQNDPMHAKKSVDRSTKWIFAVLAFFGFVGLLMCGGVFALVYFAANRSNVADLPTRSGGFREDAIRFNASLFKKAKELSTNSPTVTSAVPLESAAESQTTDNTSSGEDVQPVKEVRSWVEETVAKSNTGEAPSLNKRVFLAAVNQRLNPRKKNWLNSLLIEQIFSQADPSPETEGTGIVLDVQRNGRFARADLLFQSYTGDSLSIQWFLILEDANWTIYDWQRMEYGRRASEEYANYFENIDSQDVEGFDLAIAKLGSAVSKSEDRNAALREIREAEAIKVLPRDHHVRLLRTAWSYQELDSHTDALRCLNSISDKHASWGVWQTIYESYRAQGKDEDAAKALEEAIRQSPSHPNMASRTSESLLSKGKLTEAFDSSFRAWRYFPRNYMWTSNVIRTVPVGKEIEVLTAAASLDPSHEILLDVIERMSWSQRFTKDLLTQLQSKPWVSKDLFAYLQLHEVEETAEDGESSDNSRSNSISDANDKKLAIALALLTDSDSESIREKARSWFETECETRNQFDLVINNEKTRKSYLTKISNTLAYDDLWFDRQKLVTALERVSEDASKEPLVQALLGWGKQFSDPQAAKDHFELCLKEMEKPRDSVSEIASSEAIDATIETPDDQSSEWLTSIKFFLAEIMVRQGQAIPALERWMTDETIVRSIVDWTINRQDADNLPGMIKLLQEDGLPAQRWLCLKMEAALAAMSEDYKKSDELLRLASDFIRGQNDESTKWKADVIASLRGDQLMERRQLGLVPTLNEPDLERLLLEALRSADTLQDMESTTKLIEIAESSEAKSDKLNREIFLAKASIAASGQQWQQAASMQKKVLDLDGFNADRNFNSLDTIDWVNASLLAGELNEVRDKVEPLPDSRQLVVPKANYLLVSNQFDSLRELLAKSSSDSVGDWLTDAQTRKWLQDKPETMRQLYEQFAVSPFGISVSTFGNEFTQLQLDAAISGYAFDERSILSRLETLSGNQPSISKLNTRVARENEGSWIVSIGNARYGLQVNSKSRGREAMLSKELSEIVSKPLTWISLQSLQENEAIEVSLPTLLHSILDDVPEILVDIDRSIIWYGEQISKDWHTRQHPAITPKTVFDRALTYADSIQPLEEPDSAAGKRISFLQARSILKKNASQNVWVDVRLGTVTEQVPGELFGIVENESRMEIRLTGASQLAPFLQPGQRVIVYQCYRN